MGQSTSDWERFAIVCLVHPIAQEFILTFQRQAKRSYFSNLFDFDDPNISKFALTSINVTCECGQSCCVGDERGVRREEERERERKRERKRDRREI